jgi:hypothetical protein
VDKCEECPIKKAAERRKKQNKVNWERRGKEYEYHRKLKMSNIQYTVSKVGIVP